MNGSAAYDDAEVKAAMAMWKDLADKGYFAANANADSWTDASDKVARGDAAMTLMGTWITGYWNGLGLEAGKDYDFFRSRPSPRAFPRRWSVRWTVWSSPTTGRTVPAPRRS